MLFPFSISRICFLPLKNVVGRSVFTCFEQALRNLFHTFCAKIYSSSWLLGNPPSSSSDRFSTYFKTRGERKEICRKGSTAADPLLSPLQRRIYLSPTPSLSNSSRSKVTLLSLPCLLHWRAKTSISSSLYFVGISETPFHSFLRPPY